MNKFQSLLRKKERVIAGVLSGTSVDGIDVVLLKINGKGNSMKIDIIDFKTFPVLKSLKKKIIECSSVNNYSLLDICRLNVVIGRLFSKCILNIISKNKLSPEDIDLIGSHGQTFYHYPVNKKYYGFDSKSTFQIGDPSVIANTTGITTVGDFRMADIAVGGDGAPLVPYLDYILFNNKSKSIILLNIGGISNATYLKKSCSKNDVIAFDTGPGNMILDSLVRRLFNKDYDKDGIIASKGKLNYELFQYLLKTDNYFRKKYPKSTGREYYGEKFILGILKSCKKILPEDIVFTVTKYTAYTIYFNLKSFRADEIIISGGGAKNPALVNHLNDYFKNIPIYEIKKSGITAENKEAVLFAVLANELINGITANIMSVTGSFKNVFLGKICIA